MSAPIPLLIFCGPPGAGKGTQAKRITERAENPALAAATHLSSGEILREELDLGTDRAAEFMSYVSDGKLVPDEIVAGMMFDRMLGVKELIAGAAPGAPPPVILDGFPRKLSQAALLEKFADEHAFVLRAVLFFNLALAPLTERILGRVVCAVCGREANINFGESGDKCGKCGGKWTSRGDDTPETIKTRYEEYLEHTLPIVDHYRGMDLLVELDASDTVEQIERSVTDVVNKIEAVAK